jgi:peptidyl-prolyl cis-trans isomerase A (cyclophilin A)
VAVSRAWAPNGADRFHQLAASGFFDEQRFFRVLPRYIVQFGASGDPKTTAYWSKRFIPDDSGGQSNVRGTISFAHDGPDRRAHQLFFNLKDNTALDAQGFVPIGRVVEGMAAVDSINDDFGEKPSYHLIATLGNSYLRRMFPKLDYIETARVLPAGSP